ncbi:mechanosensitive ion channel family protein [Nocardioides euryhalodurans]|uniref:Mechanosensitive ion channel family protein n=1 Tax=Nocardioides euryhalodurans TaxID=2518370 RepID=A0A4P7GN45_9ACTN|nr:mechanosensitive ion channel domain-containing protein [Nocardioides euryhalodurans]QBR93304.1 mechanosensitive ion channel family protein [Nocardioides euryhalodurans]
MSEQVIYALAAILAGLALGSILGALTRRLVAPQERRRSLEGLAGPAAAFVFWVVLALGIAVAVGILAPGALEPLGERVLAFLPQVLIAILMLIVGRAAATLAGTLLGAGLARATGRTRREMVIVLRSVIMVVVVLLALGQLGVNTELLTLTFAAVLLCLATAMALLIGLGGRHVAREVAAGRYLRRILSEGDHVHTEGVNGTVVALHAATTEMEGDAPGTTHVPNTVMLDGPITVTRPPRPEQ